MEKSIKVFDTHANVIGSTYPKRAAGLVKKGRAEYADSLKSSITLLDKKASETGEVINMDNNIIDFNAREFCFDKDCSEKAGARMMLTDIFGENTEAFEIGDNERTRTQIVCTKKLEADSSYIFRFAMTGGHNELDEVVTQLVAVPFDGEEPTKEEMDEGRVYPLNRSRFKPSISKRCGESILRVFEIPFNTGKSGKVRLMFISQHAVCCIMKAHETADYDGFEDLSFDEWYRERRELLKEDTPVRELNLSGAVINETLLERFIELAGQGYNINLAGAVIYTPDSEDDSEEPKDTESGERIYGLKFAYEELKNAYEDNKSPAAAQVLERLRQELDADIG